MARDSKMLLHNLKINLSKLRFGDYSFLRLPKQQFSRRGHTQVRRWERFKTFSTEVDLAGSAQNQVQLFCKLYMQMCILQTNIVTLSQTGSGCGQGFLMPRPSQDVLPLPLIPSMKQAVRCFTSRQLLYGLSMASPFVDKLPELLLPTPEDGFEFCLHRFGNDSSIQVYVLLQLFFICCINCWESNQLTTTRTVQLR